MRLFKNSMTFDEMVLLAGEERLHAMFFGFVDVPEPEWDRRVQFRDKLDNTIGQLSGAVNRHKIWRGREWVA